MSLIHKPIEKLTNKFTLANTYIKRVYAAAPGSKNTAQDNYYGDRYAFLYQGNYNFDLDNSIVFGLDREDDRVGYNAIKVDIYTQMLTSHLNILITKVE